MKKVPENTILTHPEYSLEKEHLDDTIMEMKKAIPILENEGFKINAWDTEVDIRSKRALTVYRRRKAGSGMKAC